ncbi:hypothetical protein BJH93_11070 [Kocuria polaris]|nr:hypothetical protein [Kocuria polaris]
MSRLIRQPPLVSPHHTATMAALVGGGSGFPRTGAASRAQRGVLFLDEARNGKHTSLAMEVTDECHRQEARTQRTARTVCPLLVTGPYGALALNCRPSGRAPSLDYTSPVAFENDHAGTEEHAN